MFLRHYIWELDGNDLTNFEGTKTELDLTLQFSNPPTFLYDASIWNSSGIEFKVGALGGTRPPHHLIIRGQPSQCPSLLPTTKQSTSPSATPPITSPPIYSICKGWLPPPLHRMTPPAVTTTHVDPCAIPPSPMILPPSTQTITPLTLLPHKRALHQDIFTSLEL